MDKPGRANQAFLKLLSRFYPVSEGAILLDDINLNELSLAESTKLISAVPQEIFLFQGSLRDNLRFGNDKASDEEIWQALKTVQMSELVIERGGLDFMKNREAKVSPKESRQLYPLRAPYW